MGVADASEKQVPRAINRRFGMTNVKDGMTNAKDNDKR
jgi:hypothetical protein